MSTLTEIQKAVKEAIFLPDASFGVSEAEYFGGVELRKEVLETANDTLRELEQFLFTAPERDAIQAIEHYEMLYRLTDQTLRRLSEVNRTINDITYNAWQAYHKSLGQIPFHPLFAAVSDTLRRRPERRFLGRIFDWHANHLDRFCRQYTLSKLVALQTSNDPLTEETRTVLSHLTREDLYPWFGSQTQTYRSLLTQLLFLPHPHPATS